MLARETELAEGQPVRHDEHEVEEVVREQLQAPDGPRPAPGSLPPDEPPSARDR